ncbi:hypothetical protein TcasGA2_TC016207 [Tribolium castaneum]|uniref:Major facilitator superfamily associated domain-containing protein n=1 Tax=Tribolium castaneum TaxID=7070 RepID=D6X4Q3_TRICA|nr:hypothetical protein TcasGA2_TC016207 [Tribolium castaneum]
MGLSNVQLLLLSVFLYFFAVGILQAALSRHIMLKGGTHHIQGWVAALIFILQSIAKELTALFEHGKKHALNFCLFSVFFIFFTFVFEDGLWVTLGLRLVFVLMQYVEEDTDIKRPQTHFKQMPSICYHRLKNLKTVNYKKHWDCMLLQAAYTTTFSIYFVRFCFLLVFNYNLGTVVVGYSIAYQHMWLFATSMLVPFVKERVQNKKKLFEHSLLISGFLLPGLYYAPSYECYLFLLIPMFFCFMLVNALLDDDALGLSLKPDVFEASNTIAYLVNVIGPIFFGIVCQYFGGYGFKFFSLLPMVICVYLLNQRFMKTEQEQETEARIKQD